MTKEVEMSQRIQSELKPVRVRESIWLISTKHTQKKNPLILGKSTVLIIWVGFFCCLLHSDKNSIYLNRNICPDTLEQNFQKCMNSLGVHNFQ